MSTEQREPQQYLTISELAHYLGIPVDTLYGWRTKGYGPPAGRFGRHLRYRLSDVEAWADAQLNSE